MTQHIEQTVYLSVSTFREVKLAAESSNRSRSEICREAITEWLKDHRDFEEADDGNSSG